MQAVGYPGEWVDITSVYALNVYSRAAIKKIVRGPASNFYQYKANIEALSPTWDAVRHFVMWSFQSINLTIPNAVSDTLDKMSADELTGCPAQVRGKKGVSRHHSHSFLFNSMLLCDCLCGGFVRLIGGNNRHRKVHGAFYL